MMAMTTQQGEPRGRNTKGLGTNSARGRGVGCNPRGKSSGRSRSAGRVAADNTTAVRRHRKRPEWDDSLRDPTQYRLTPEEAAQRKKSLVSKHNTLVFGLGGGGGDGNGGRAVFAAAATTPKEGKMESAAARPRSASEQRAEQARKVYGGGGQRHLRRSRSSSGTSAARRRGSGKTETTTTTTTTTLPAAEVTVIEGNDAVVGGVNDVTTAGGIDEHGGPASAVGRPWVRVDGSGDCGEEGKGKSLAGGDALGLAGIEVGIKAFSERVWRLETYRRAGVEAGNAEDSNAGEEQRLKTGVTWKRTGVEEGAAYEEGGDGGGDNVDNSLACDVTNESNRTVHPEDIAAGDVSDGVGRDVFNDSDYQYATEQNLQQRSPPCHEALGSPWDNHGELAGQKLRTRKCKSGDDAGDDAGHFVARDSVEADLVGRIQLLEAQVLRLHDAPVAAALASEDEKGNFSAGGALAGEEGQAAGARTGPARAAEYIMRVMVTDLLSLTARLLKRATAAEQRLRDVRTNAVSLGGGDGANKKCNSDVCHERRPPDADEGNLSVLRDRARSIALSRGRVATGKGQEEEEEVWSTPVDIREYGGQNNDQDMSFPVTEQQEDRCSSSPSSPPAKACTLLWQEGSRSRRKETPAVHQLRTTSSSTPTKDCWGEALDAVGNLVASRPTGDDATTAVPAAAEANALPIPFPVPPPSPSPSPCGRPFSNAEGLRPIPAPTDMPSLATAAAVVTAAVHRGREHNVFAGTAQSPFRVFGSPTAASPSRPLRPPPSRDVHVASLATRRWGPRFPLTPLKTMPVMSGDSNTTTPPANNNVVNNVNYERGSPFSSPEPVRKERDVGDALSVPTFSAPTPVKKPQHPFERAPEIRSPRWLVRHERRVVVDKTARTSGVVFDGGSGGGGKRSASLAADANVLTVGTEKLARDGSGGVLCSVVKSPPIGQWYTPSR